ncbi:unnamed protein product [Caenorhabditis auriculariae]|uniref:Transmembrane protein n=1 Tax=Caenorhabditis auriculariae TaxID=2777116 RepID=A0A8S1GNU0_9PELO|nr:unnamed protein product [Caenorhabditis auriculariae]
MTLARESVIEANQKEAVTVLETENDRLIMALLLIIMPPLAVFFKCRGCSKHMCINIFLLLLLVLPAYCHAVWFCFIRNQNTVVVRDSPSSPAHISFGNRGFVEHRVAEVTYVKH